MHTILEQAFQFTAEDLIANRDTKLSDAQFTDYDRERRLIRIRFRYIYGALALFILTVIGWNIVHWWFWRSIMDLSSLIFIGVFVGGTTFFRWLFRTALRQYATLDNLVVANIGGVRRSDFTIFKESPVRMIFHAPHGDLILNQDQFDALEHDGVYRFYYWSGDYAHKDWGNDILSVEQTDGIEKTVTDLEYHFDFYLPDLVANQQQTLSNRQRRRYQHEYKETFREALAMVGLVSLIGVGALIDGFGKNYLQNEPFMNGSTKLALFSMGIAIFIGILTASTRSRLRRVLQTAEIWIRDNVHRAQFENYDVPESDDEYYGVQLDKDCFLSLTQAQLDALGEDQKYRFYVWAESGEILTVEPME